MPFKDTQEGTTHSYNDGCGDPTHNNKTPCHLGHTYDPTCLGCEAVNEEKCEHGRSKMFCSGCIKKDNQGRQFIALGDIEIYSENNNITLSESEEGCTCKEGMACSRCSNNKI